MFNQAVLDSLPSGTYSTAAQEPCYLLEYASGQQEAEAAKLWQFLYNPVQLEYSREARYAEVPTQGVRVPQQQFQHSTGKTLNLSGLVLDAWWMGKSVQPLVDGLDTLIEASIEEQQYSPPVLSFVMGSRTVLAPCVLQRVTVKENGWLAGGQVARASVDLVLLEVPSEDIDRGQDAATVTPDEAAAEEGRPRLPLTDRQRQDASARAKTWLNENLSTLAPNLRPLVQSNSYLLATDAETGDVTMYDADRQAIGVVGRWDGQETFTTAGVQTVPMAET